MENNLPVDITQILTKKQVRLKRLVNQQHNYERQPSKEFDEYIKREIRAYTDFVNSHIDEIVKNREANAIYTNFKNTFFKNF
tara:strand:+ start:132 stop:377 length:246 start_codon:yes stop_codon:yes gene_type:complete